MVSSWFSSLSILSFVALSLLQACQPLPLGLYIPQPDFRLLGDGSISSAGGEVSSSDSSSSNDEKTRANVLTQVKRMTYNDDVDEVKAGGFDIHDLAVPPGMPNDVRLFAIDEKKTMDEMSRKKMHDNARSSHAVQVLRDLLQLTKPEQVRHIIDLFLRHDDEADMYDLRSALEHSLLDLRSNCTLPATVRGSCDDRRERLYEESLEALQVRSVVDLLPLSEVNAFVVDYLHRATPWQKNVLERIAGLSYPYFTSPYNRIDLPSPSGTDNTTICKRDIHIHLHGNVDSSSNSGSGSERDKATADTEPSINKREDGLSGVSKSDASFDGQLVQRQDDEADSGSGGGKQSQASAKLSKGSDGTLEKRQDEGGSSAGKDTDDAIVKAVRKEELRKRQDSEESVVKPPDWIELFKRQPTHYVLPSLPPTPAESDYKKRDETKAAIELRKRLILAPLQVPKSASGSGLGS